MSRISDLLIETIADTQDMIDALSEGLGVAVVRSSEGYIMTDEDIVAAREILMGAARFKGTVDEIVAHARQEGDDEY